MRLSRLVPLVAVPVLLLAGCALPGSRPSSTPPGTGPTTARTTASCDNGSVLAGWSVTKLAEQTVVVPVDETNVASIAGLVGDGAGGVILFGTDAPSSLGSDLAALVRKAPDGVQPLIMTDEEGGVVQRMANLVGDIPSARSMASTMSATQIHDLAKQAGTKMLANGVTMDLAPVLDLDDRPGPSDTNPDGTRSFSKDHTVAQTDGIAFAQGLTDAGVVPVVKHFPGLGGSTGNTDVVAAPTLPWSTLQQAGLLPFTAAINAGVPAVMIANATVPGLSTLPASLSPKVITDVLRQQLHFNGLVMTDSLSAVAISSAGYTIPTATVAALAAGADMILFTADDVPGTTHDTVQAIVSAVGAGTLSRGRLTEAVEHILTVKKTNLCRP